jgi:hypothetical protein
MKKLKEEIRKRSKEEILELKSWISSYLTFMNKTSFKIGDKVYFESTKYGKINGTIEKINTKTISLINTKSELGKTWRGWRVHPNLLNKG